MAIYDATGVLKYSDRSLSLNLRQDIVEYYRNFIPKWIDVNRQRFPAHISVVRNEPNFNKNMWRKHEGRRVQIQYDSHIHNGQVYYWLDAFSVVLEDIRKELDLPIKSPYNKPPAGYGMYFHITLANMK